MRTFIAFDISNQTRAALRRAQKEMGRIDGVRWANPDGIHLTMKFIGEIKDALLGDVFEVMKAAVAGVAVFEFTVKGVGCFPSQRRPRVLWAGVEPAGGSLSEVASRLDLGLRSVGVAPEKRAFRPHITLGRVRGRIDGRGLEAAFERFGEREFGRNEARELVLFGSELHPGGARYTRLGAVPLEGRGKEEI